MTEITTRQHGFVKRCRAVVARRGEDEVVLLDGEHLIGDALAAGVVLEGLLTDGQARDVVAVAAARGVPVFRAASDIISAASPVRTPTGVVALARWAPVSIEDALAGPAPLVVGLVGVQDPGNVGSVIRSAEALGATGVVALDDTADPAGWRALRGAMGSTFRMVIGRGQTTDLLTAARRRAIPVAGTTLSGGTAVGRAPITTPLIILFGGEGPGLSVTLLASCDRRLTIPMKQGVNSLNVSVSVALILWEARRASTAAAGE